MGYSSLVVYKNMSPNHSGHRNHSIDSVAIHTMAFNGTIERCGEGFANPERRASSNYGIGSDGRIGLYVDEDNRSWCTSNAGVDNRAITIEVASTTSEHPWACTDEAYEALINLCVDICRRNNIPGLRWKADAAYGVAASNGGPVTDQNMFAHRWFAKKACPGDYLYERFGAIANEVNTRLQLNIPLQGAGSQQRKLIFVGDSRTVGMRSAVGDDGNIWSCDTGKGFNWMKDVGVPAIESNIDSTTAVVILVGVNDFIGQAKRYSAYLNTKAAEWKAKGATVYYVSVNPVSKSGYTYSPGRQMTNAMIQEFNNEVRSSLSSDIAYLDTYSAIIDTFNSPDGLHYDAATYKQIYQIITSQIGTSGYASVVGNVTVDYTRIKPYLLTLDRNTANSFNYKLLKEYKVIGAIVEGLQYYNIYHNLEVASENPKLSAQIKALSDADLPYGLFMVGRARNSQEAANEMYRYSFPLRRYTVSLGAWIKLELTNPTRVNDLILERYKQDLIRLGFKHRMGIICTREQLRTISWDKYQNDFYLWLVDHVDNLDVLDELLTPEFFDVDGE